MVPENNEMLNKNKKLLLLECDEGLNGNVELPIRDICFAITNKCNLHCVLCPYVLPEYENKTFRNEPPYSMTLEEFRKIFTKEWADQQRFGGDGKAINEAPLNIHFTHGEPFLNKDLAAIILYIRSIIPEAFIRISTNGTIPPEGIKRGDELVKHVNLISFSIDGCSPKTFELLRAPAKYNHVLKSLQKWSKTAESIAPRKVFRMGVALSSINIEEISGIVRLAAKLGGYESIYLQPIIVDKNHQEMQYARLENYDKAKGKELLEEAIELANKYDIKFTIVDSIKRLFNLGNVSREMPFTPEMNQYCKHLRCGFVEVNPDGSLQQVCCFMDNDNNNVLIDKYGINKRVTSPIEMYNSPGFWRLRKDILNGQLLNYCRDCEYGSKDYHFLTNATYKPHIETKDNYKEKCFALRKALADERKLNRQLQSKIKNQ